MATGKVHEVLPPVLDSNSEPPTLFDGTTRLYTSYICPYAQRVWIVRNYKGLQDVIKLVPIDLGNRPAWYKEKVYPPNKVPSLEHNNEIKGESLDLIKYIDSHFEGPSLLPEDPAKRKFTEEMFSYSDKFNGIMRNAFSSEEGVANEIDGPLDHLENALSKFDDGPFFLGQFSLVDIAYAPFFERPYLLFLNLKNYDITTGRPKLKLCNSLVNIIVIISKINDETFSMQVFNLKLRNQHYIDALGLTGLINGSNSFILEATLDRRVLGRIHWLWEMNKIDGYVQTRCDPQELVAVLTKHFTGK